MAKAASKPGRLSQSSETKSSGEPNKHGGSAKVDSEQVASVEDESVKEGTKAATNINQPLDLERIRELIKEMINPVKERQDDEFEKIRSDIRAELSVIKDIPTAKEMAWGLIAVFLGAVGLIVTLSAVMGDRFDNGISTGSAIGERLEETRALNLENSRNFKRLLEKLDENESKNKQP